MQIQQTKKDPKKKPSKKDLKKRARIRWIVAAFLLSFFITAILAIVTGELAEQASIWTAVPLLLFFILVGILFDIIGLAVATVDPSPFNSMAARRLKTGKKAVWLVNNSAKVTSFCNDIVGDICGVVSGATGTAIAAKLFIGEGAFWLTLSLTSLIAALTVGCKAIGKEIALRHNETIVLVVAKILCGFRK